MNADSNVATIQNVYEAFGHGDLRTILDALADDVEWGADTSSNASPWYGLRHGKDEVQAFFQEFGSNMEVEEFTPLIVLGNDDAVLSVVRCRARSRSTGRAVDMNLHHYFKFRDGKVYYYRGTEDTAQTEWALKR